MRAVTPAPAPESVADLERLLRERLGEGRAHGPDHPVFAQTTTLWNGAVRDRPALVVRPRDAAETAVAVTAAVRCGVAVSVRGGGHDWAGRSLRDRGLVIDLRDLRAVEVVGDEAVVGGGALARDVVAAAAPHGLNVATGTAGAVGMAGLTLGGGYGPLLGTCGLAADNLLAAEVVLADGRVVSTEDEPELLWALRGGGGNFGVVTSLRIRLHPDRGLVGGVVLFGGEQSAEVLRRYADLVATAPEGLTTLVELTEVPELGPCVLAVPVWSGAPAGAEDAMAAVTVLGQPIWAAVGPTTQAELLARFDEQVPVGMHWSLRTRTVEALTSGVADVLLAAAADRPGPGCGVGVRQFHGAATRYGSDDAAFARRERHLVLELSAGRAAEDDPAPYRAWVERLCADLAPHALPGGYPNFLLADQIEQVAHAYGSGPGRLLAAKVTYDPDHVFTAIPLPHALVGAP